MPPNHIQIFKDCLLLYRWVRNRYAVRFNASWVVVVKELLHFPATNPVYKRRQGDEDTLFAGVPHLLVKFLGELHLVLVRGIRLELHDVLDGLDAPIFKGSVGNPHDAKSLAERRYLLVEPGGTFLIHAK